MASNGASTHPGRRLSFGHHSLTNASLMVEKQKAGLRRSTPDSEALASSEDEQDLQHRGGLGGPSNLTTRPPRRSSWINDDHHNVQGKPSLGTSEPRSPGGLHHTGSTPEPTNWSSAPLTIGRNHSASTSLPWSSPIWNNDAQKGLPARFTEVLSSPTALGSAGGFNEEVLNSPSRRGSSSEAAIPFAIPLQPTLKSYRSQSYSVGQLDQDPSAQSQSRLLQHTYSARTRAGSSYSGLQHRPSRPSVLGEFSAETSSLGQVREVDDDEESTASSDTHMRFSSTQARKIEQLARENAILRQRAQLGQSVGMTAHVTPHAANSNQASRVANRGMQISDSVLEEPDDQMIDEDSALTSSLAYRIGNGMRPSEYAASSNGQASNASLDQRAFVSGKKGHWQSSLGFGGSTETPQSRRHSFADVPLRLDSSHASDIGSTMTSEGVSNFSHSDLHTLPLQTDGVPVSFLPHGPGHSSEGFRTMQGQALVQGGYSNPQQARLGHFSPIQPLQPQSLYLVTFKAARAEFYYVQEGTGLDVNPGDLVIVEADRGTDLGTVAHKNVDWASARELKEHYVVEHFNWLMMFSRQGQHSQGMAPQGWTQGSYPDRASHSAGNTMGHQGPISPGDGLSTEIKPKMIKRLAQNHEIYTLREKEGNEAKAKRMCQQKVAEHHLTMEILDAEFQMDWKKLTFYYFADSYINFNSLVTDLFKIYKTRIWMSAINPASFVSPITGPQLLPTVAQAAAKPDHGRFGDTRINVESLPVVSSISPEKTLVSAWHTQNERGMASPLPGSYGQYWAGAGYLQLPPAGQDFSQAGSSTLHSSRMLNASFEVGSGSRPQPKTAYKGEHLASPYTDQLQALQGLALGPS